MPRLLMRMSVSATLAIRAFAPSAVPRSAAKPVTSAFGSVALICAIACCTRCSVRPFTTTAAPALARPCAIACPIPAVEPVTIAVLPSRLMIILRFLSMLSRCRPGMHGFRTDRDRMVGRTGIEYNDGEADLRAESADVGLTEQPHQSCRAGWSAATEGLVSLHPHAIPIREKPVLFTHGVFIRFQYVFPSGKC